MYMINFYNMKQMLAFLFFFGCVELAAKDLYHFPVVGNIVKQQVECLHFDSDDLHPIWNLSQLETERNSYLLSYEKNPTDDKVLIGTEHNTRYFHQCCSDSLLLWGYENHMSKVEYDIPELILKENLGLENHIDGVFHGLEFYGGRLSFRLFGTYRLEVKSKGTMVLPSGDSLRHVTMVHYVKTICKEKYSKVKSLEKLRSIVFSSRPYNADSIITRVNSDENQIIVHQYRWYADGYRYPVYETMTTGTATCPNLYELAFCCPPEEQAKEYDVINERVRSQRSINAGYANDSETSQEVGNASVEISGKLNAHNFLSVCLDVLKAGYTDVLVYTDNGILVTAKTNMLLSPGKSYCSFDVSSHNSDVYIVTCIVDGRRTSIKVQRK